MPGITGFEYDIFISYAHLDNEVMFDQKDGWVQQFYENLKLMLDKRFGRSGMVKIWLDQKRLLGNTVFDKSIAETIEKSAIMISLNSTCYKESAYCQKELDMFYQKAQKEPQGLLIGDKSRIVHVLINNIHFKDWPKELSGTSGFHFHDAQDDNDLGDVYDTTSKKFRNGMRELRDAIWILLKDFQKQDSRKEVFDKLVEIEEDNPFSVYIAEVSDPLRSSKKRIINELQKKNYKVIDGPPPPIESNLHYEATKEAIAKSQLSIHLLDQFPGRDIEGDSDNYFPKKQFEIGLDMPASQLVWMPDTIDFEDIEELNYKTFLKSIEEGKIHEKPFEFIKGSKGNLSQEILDYADELKKKQEVKIQAKGPLSVLLDTHFTDQKYAFSLSQTLMDHNILPVVNPEEDDPQKNLKILSERMSQVKKLVFLYGSVSKEWVTERMRAALKLIIDNNYPISDIFVYMAPPHKEANDIELTQNFLKVNVVNSSQKNQIDEAALTNFLKDLQKTA